MKGQRITLLRAGKPKRTVVIVEPPFAEMGDVCNLDGFEWIVCGIENTDFLLIPVKKPETVEEAKAKGAADYRRATGQEE